MPQKDHFESLVACFADFKVIRGIEVEQGECFRQAVHIKNACLQRVDTKIPGLLRSVRVKFNSVATRASSGKQMHERHAISHAWIERGKFGAGDETTLQ